MTHLIDKDALIAEIKNRRDSFYSLSESCEKGTPARAGFYAQAQTLEGILSFLDTLEVKKVQEELLSEDLEEAVNAYIGYAPEVDECSSTYGKRQAFKAGAQWQKSKDESSTEDLEEASKKYSSCIYLEEVLSDDDKEVLKARLINTFKAGYKFGKEQTEIQIKAQSMALAHGCPKEPVSEDLEEAASRYAKEEYNRKSPATLSNRCIGCYAPLIYAFKAGANWQKEHLWKPADGDDLPEIDREVIALLSNGKVVYAHRPQEYWDGKNIATEEVTRYYPARYDKGGWNIPDVKFWLDCELPIKEE